MALLRKSLYLLPLFLLAFVGCKSAEQAEAEKKAIEADTAALQGKWKVASRAGDKADPDADEDDEEAKKAKKADDDSGLSYTVEKDTLTIAFNGEVWERWKLTINPQKDPKTVDLVLVDEKGSPITRTERVKKSDKKNKNKTSEKKVQIKRVGVYKVDGDKLELCLSWGEKDRPSTFEAPARSGRELLKLSKSGGKEEKKEEKKVE